MAKGTRSSFRTRLVAGGVALLALAAAVLSFGSRNAGPANVERALGPLASYALPADRRIFFRGRVLQRLSAGSYLYLQVLRENGEQSWVVTLASARVAASGTTQVQVAALGYAEHFESKRLARDFSKLYFAVVRAS